MRGQRKNMVGRVVSNKMEKTVVVVVETQKRHRLYGKVVRKAKRYKAHDEGSECLVGDQVRILESRPLSRDKRWVVEGIMERAE